MISYTGVFDGFTGGGNHTIRKAFHFHPDTGLQYRPRLLQNTAYPYMPPHQMLQCFLGGFTDASVKDILDMNFGVDGFKLDWVCSDMDGKDFVAA